MQYQDFTIAINEFQGNGYPVSALADEIGRVTAVLPYPDDELKARLAAVADLQAGTDGEIVMRQAGEALFRWVMAGPIESHLRIAWDRAQHAHQGLRLRLSLDSPALGAWPWELLHDPERDHTFAASYSTLLVRYYDQANHLGSLAEQQTDLPLRLLLVLPVACDLNLANERRSIEQVAASMTTALRVRALEGVVTRSDLADALLMGDYDIVHFSGHGAFLDGRGYAALNLPDGSPDWIHSGTLSRLASNHRSIRLVILNVCGGGYAEDGRAFQGLASQMVRYGVPAVVAMQYPITDEAAAIFAREFYKRLCVGEDAGQVDVAVTYARGMLSIMYPGDRCWVAPVLYTHAADGVIYKLPGEPAAQAALSTATEAERLRALADSLQRSLGTTEDWALTEPGVLEMWGGTLRRAEEAYRTHLSDPNPEIQQVARRGVALIQRRLAAMERALA
jgi:hypothetical protein